MARIVYRVVPDGQGWQLRRNETVLKRYADQDGAVDEARHLAIRNKPSRVVIHDTHAHLQQERDDDPDSRDPATGRGAGLGPALFVRQSPGSAPGLDGAFGVK